ncbi:hypothetical protein [Paenibacillus rhizophilus]|uniref:Uncharacterized protein n=1 Tax=Paenibacillus rhizophilus TaxID=1850366 RepID=A0A3N9PAH7_9BACL|nr:hypothetical protein [Paenibacillus rhizophilus]RQW13248.1 hypothetical protein EH198_02115 [Paenibacillus rhizophilus]
MYEDESKELSRFLMPEGGKEPREKELLQLTEETERMCRLHYISGGTENDLFVYVSKDKIIVDCHKTSASSSYELKEADNLEGVRTLLLDGISLPKTSCGDSPALLMSRHEYHEIRKKAAFSSLSELSRQMEAATGDSGLSALFAQSVKSRHLTGELRICSRSCGGWSFQYASFLADLSCGWLLRMSCGSEEDWMSAAPVGKEQFSAAFLRWLLHLKPLVAAK